MKNDVLYKNEALSFENELVAFLMLSGKFGEDFIGTPLRKRKIEDYGRSLGICIIFEFKRTLLKLTKEAGNKIDDVINYLKIEGKKLSVVEGWVNDVMKNISDAELKKLAIGLWEEKKSKNSEKDFDIAKLFK